MTPDQLKQYRLHHGISQTQLADYLGLKQRNTIGRWERGISPIPAWAELILNHTTSWCKDGGIFTGGVRHATQ